jgi:hypothetical protein
MFNWITHLTKGKWYCGCSFYKGKPMIFIGRGYYDGWHYGFHLGPFWVSVSYD